MLVLGLVQVLGRLELPALALGPLGLELGLVLLVLLVAVVLGWQVMVVLESLGWWGLPS